MLPVADTHGLRHQHLTSQVEQITLKRWAKSNFCASFVNSIIAILSSIDLVVAAQCIDEASSGITLCNRSMTIVIIYIAVSGRIVILQ